MRLVLDVENTVIKRDGKLHLDPYEPTNSLVMVGLLTEGGEPKHYTFDHADYDCIYEYRKRDCDEIQEILDNTTQLIAHNAQHDLLWLWETGFNYDGAIWDTMLGEYILQRGQKEPLSLEACAERYDLDTKKQDSLKEWLKAGKSVRDMDHTELSDYLSADLHATQQLYDRLRMKYEDCNSL